MTLPDKADIATYGGILQNYGEVADPSTDLDATAFNDCRADVAGMTNVIQRALVSFLGHATTPADPSTGFVHSAVWGEGALVKPTKAKVSTGRYRFTWPATVTDELGESRSVNFRRARGWAEGATAYHVQCEVTSANVIDVRVFDMAGTPTDAAGVTITVEAV